MSPPVHIHRTPALVARLRRNTERIVGHVTDGYLARHPDCVGDRADRLRRYCREDMDHHLNHFYSALELQQPAAFGAYIRWLRSVLEHREMSMDHPLAALTLLREWMLFHLEPDLARDGIELIDAGIDLLLEAAPPGTPREQSLSGGPVEALTMALLDGQRRTAEQQLLDDMASGASLVDVSVDLVQPALYEIGWLWQQNRISVAQEHLATALTQNALAAAYAKASFRAPNGRTALFACVEDNHHSIGLRMVSDAFELAGWEVAFLGADTPADAILTEILRSQPMLIGLSASMPHQIVAIRDIIARVRSELGNAAPSILIGGLAFNTLGGNVLRLGADDLLTDARAAAEAAAC